jgi:hypothetical protein
MNAKDGWDEWKVEMWEDLNPYIIALNKIRLNAFIKDKY